jgi:hypothetical protein
LSTLSGSTVVVIGGTSGAKVVGTGRDEGRRKAVGDELGATTATLDLADSAAVSHFFAELPAPVDHVLLSGGGPIYAPIRDMDFVDTPLSVRLLGDQIERRREELRTTLPIVGSSSRPTWRP